MKKALHHITQYCTEHTSLPSTVLHELERETWLKTLAPQMLSGHLQGQLFRFLSQMIRPRNVLEIGTFTGYTAICLAAGLPAGGQLHTVEVNEELEYLIRKYIQKADLTEKIQLHIGSAKDIVPNLDAQLVFDLVFIDAGKKDNDYYYELALARIPAGAYILIDNVLWDGKVAQKGTNDHDTRTIHGFNEKVQADERVENLMLPIRDGVLLVRKLG
ncbi:MAG: class I SAM-dependent methyltransferase [Bacteroidota bacterium]